MTNIVVDLMDYTNRPILKRSMINIVKGRFEVFDIWLSVGPIQADVDGFNVLNAIAGEHVNLGDSVVVLFEVESFGDRSFDSFIFNAFEEWGRITVYTEPTIVT